MIASFALQESSCQPNTTGEGGEQGLMQISQDKCTGAPDGNCKDPVSFFFPFLVRNTHCIYEKDFNIGVGAKFFANTLKNNNGNVIQSIGQYNGWFVGMTIVCISLLVLFLFFFHGFSLLG
jgi:soluble lytic murein transglycosylase-like protein